jgi:hypothetical protein
MNKPKLLGTSHNTGLMGAMHISESTFWQSDNLGVGVADVLACGAYKETIHDLRRAKLRISLQS